MADSKMSDILKIWKSMSLTSDPPDKYSLQHVALPDPNIKKSFKPSDTFKAGEERTDVLPEPKINKINGSMFCLHLKNQLKIYRLPSDDERLMYGMRKTFREFSINYDDNIKFISGDKELIYVGFEHELRVLRCRVISEKDDDGKEVKIVKEMEQIQHKQLPNLKAVAFFNKGELENNCHLVTVTKDKIYKYNVHDEFKLVSEFSVKFADADKTSIFGATKPILMVTEGQTTAFLFSTRVESREKGRVEILYLTKFIFEGDRVEATISMIDRVFEIGIFGKSKIFHIGPSVFLVSLYEEIIVVKYHFEKYVVWDNISLAPSKSNEKKGQLVLADEIVMVYTENGEISAHNIYFSGSEGKLKCPNIDNFKGNDNDEEILYDAIVLQYNKSSFMKVLFYFKELDVYTPRNPLPQVKNDAKGQIDNKNQNNLNFNIVCIKQQDPVTKLGQLFKLKKNPQEINEFVKRFNIDELRRSKCEWSVSDRTEKDIEFLLLEINDNTYIQDELTKILKEKPHDLRFLKTIEFKQTSRYQKLLAQKILKLERSSGKADYDPRSPYTTQEREYIKNIIIWVMESIMFRKKIVYSSNFLEFKEYDFIEIGKLKAASLKEEIKLLSEKGFMKRLKYFLNSFKYMALANFEDIFTFLIDDKNEEEIKTFFIKYFPFILPKFEEISDIYKKKNASNFSRKKKSFLPVQDHEIKFRKQSFNPASTSMIAANSALETVDECQLWNGVFVESEIETKKIFKQMIIKEIEREKSLDKAELGLKAKDAIQNFENIFDEFVEEEWFKKNKSKQHSIIHISIEELRKEFEYLKTNGVFHFMIKFFETKVKEGTYKAEKVDDILRAFVKADLIPESFKANVDARRNVLIRLPEKIGIERKKELSEFLVMEETDYFDLLMKDYKELLLNQIKEEYDKIEKGFFREKFQIYLHSEIIELEKIILFFDEFHGNENDDIRKDVFNCIKNILKLKDLENTQEFVKKLMDREILRDDQTIEDDDSELIDEAKVVFGFYFYDFLNYFDLDYTYNELIEFTKIQSLDQNVLLLSILDKYCSGNEKSDVHLNIEGGQGMEGLAEPIYIDEAINFFGLLLLIIENMKFKTNKLDLFDKFVELMLEKQKYDDLAEFAHTLRIVGEGDEEDEEEMVPQDKHTFVLEDFYNEGEDLMERIVTCIIKWVRKKYYYSKKFLFFSPTQKENIFEALFDDITEALGVVEQFNENRNKEVIQESSFLSMLKSVKRIFSPLLPYIIDKRFENYIIGQEEEKDLSEMMNETSGFMFMMSLLDKIDSKMLALTDETLISETLTEIGFIYDNFNHASNFKQDSKDLDDQFGLTRFFMEYSLRLIHEHNFKYCLQAVLKTINTEYYFRNIFFEFVSNLHLPNPYSLIVFIQEFIATGAKNTMVDKLMRFCVENNVEEFESDLRQAENNTKIVFEAIVKSGRVDEAFYFLIRNNRLQILLLLRSEMLGGKSVESYALVAIYLKCLKKYLCKSFYPTFDFYMHKHSLLVNEFERKDIIKDINIAICRMKQMVISKEVQVNNSKKFVEAEIVFSDEFISNIQIGKLTQEEKSEQEAFEKNRIKNIREQDIQLKENSKKDLEFNLHDLNQIYIMFMQKKGLDPQIKLDSLGLKQAKLSHDDYDRLITTEELEAKKNRANEMSLNLGDTFQLKGKQQNRRIILEERVEDQEEKEMQQKKKQIQEKGGARILEMQMQAQKFTRELERTNEEFKKSRQEMSKVEIPKDNFKIYEELKEKEKKELASVKSSYRSKASENVNKLLEDLKQRRNKLYERSDHQTSNYEKVDIQSDNSYVHQIRKNKESGININVASDFSHKQDPKEIQSASNQIVRVNSKGAEGSSPITNSMNYGVTITGIHGSRKNGFLPLTFKEGVAEKGNIASDYINRMKERKESLTISEVKSHKGSLLSLESLLRLFEERESKQCRSYIEKLSFIKTNLEVGVQITKSVYSVINGFDMFVKFLEYLFHSNPAYKAVLEYKAFQIAAQALGIEQKINLKDLFPIDIFTIVHDVPMKEYYKVAYKIMRPNLLKILRSPDTNVHGVAVLFRYGFGSENVYYSLVFEDYIEVLLEEYASKEFEEVKLYRIADKIRNLYSNISSEGREGRFEKLMGVLGEKKRKSLINEMLSIVQKRKQILSKDQACEIKAVLMRIK